MTRPRLPGMDGMEQAPDIAALTARLGLQGLAYRTFPRPIVVPAMAVAPALPEAPPWPVTPALRAAPAMPVVQAAPALPAVANLPNLPPVPTNLASMAPPMEARWPADSGPHFPLLTQALSRGGGAIPASAQPFLNLRLAVAGPSDRAET